MINPALSLDLDGTILNYGDHKDIRFNPALIPLLSKPTFFDFGNGKVLMKFSPGLTIGIATNQGGLVFSPTDPRYPTPKDFAARLNAAIKWLKDGGYYVEDVRVSLYHHFVNRKTIEQVAQQVRKLAPEDPHIRTVVYTTARARKPSGMMLRAQKPLVYAGDSPEDAKAAVDAGIPFILVPRFT